MEGLKGYRKEIDIVDKEIISLLAKRFRIVEKVGIYKKQKGIDALQKGRFEEVLKTRKEYAKELGISENFIEKIWNEIHGYALNLEK